MKNHFELAELEAAQKQRGGPYFEFLRVPAMSAGIYVLPAGATDAQKPHREDEIYYVLSGRARMFLAAAPGKAGEEFAVSRGQIIFVPAEAAHRFFDIVEELKLLVFFAPAESG